MEAGDLIERFSGGGGGSFFFGGGVEQKSAIQAFVLVLKKARWVIMFTVFVRQRLILP